MLVLLEIQSTLCFLKILLEIVAYLSNEIVNQRVIFDNCAIIP